MTMYQIISQTSKVLFEGKAESYQMFVEQAVTNRINLDYADFRYRNMAQFNLDGARMCHADFTGCNLDGANLSESVLNHAVFTNCSLYNACLAHSSLQACDFIHASFGATDVTQADLSDAAFSSLSAFSLNFAAARSVQRAYFMDADGRTSAMSKPPIVIHGLNPHPLIFIDKDLYLGHRPIRSRRMSEVLRYVANDCVSLRNPDNENVNIENILDILSKTD